MYPKLQHLQTFRKLNSQIMGKCFNQSLKCKSIYCTVTYAWKTTVFRIYKLQFSCTKNKDSCSVFLSSNINSRDAYCFPGGSEGKNLPAVQETQIKSLGQKIPWRREWLPTPVLLPGEFHGHRLQCMGLQRVGHDSVTTFTLFTFHGSCYKKQKLQLRRVIMASAQIF